MTVYGTPGDDRLRPVSYPDSVYGMEGNDVIFGWASSDGLFQLHGGPGNDTYVITGGDIFAPAVHESPAEGTDTVRTANWRYLLPDNVENLVLLGSAGQVGAGNDLDNTLTGGAGSDQITGYAGDDAIRGRGGNDILAGGDGNDRLVGADGDDTLIGGTGLDTLFGGVGSDRFIFTALADSIPAAMDRIVDFSVSQGDKIDLSAIDANTVGGTANDAFVYVGTSAFSGTAGELRFASGLLQADTNGDKVADMSIRVVGARSLDVGSLIL